MKPRTYATPAAFKAALEQRLRDSSKSGVELARRRQLLVFDRLLARVTRVLGKAAMLKGGLALELRLERARTTRDVDLRLVGSPSATPEKKDPASEVAAGRSPCGASRGGVPGVGGGCGGVGVGCGWGIGEGWGRTGSNGGRGGSPGRVGSLGFGMVTQI
jgi:hypothetical protein